MPNSREGRPINAQGAGMNLMHRGLAFRLPVAVPQRRVGSPERDPAAGELTP
jgi:hypothetical protein